MMASLYQSGSPACGAAALVCVSVRTSMSGSSAGRDAPNGKRHLGRIEPDARQLAVPDKIDVAHEVAYRNRCAVGLAPFPQRHFDGRLMGMERVEIDGHKDHVAVIRC